MQRAESEKLCGNSRFLGRSPFFFGQSCKPNVLIPCWTNELRKQVFRHWFRQRTARSVLVVVNSKPEGEIPCERESREIRQKLLDFCRGIQNFARILRSKLQIRENCHDFREVKGVFKRKRPPIRDPFFRKKRDSLDPPPSPIPKLGVSPANPWKWR